MPPVEGSPTIVTLDVVRVLRRRRAIGLIVRQVLRPGIGQTDLRRARKPSLSADLKTVIVRVELRSNDRNRAITSKRTNLIEDRCVCGGSERHSRILAGNSRSG